MKRNRIRQEEDEERRREKIRQEADQEEED